MNLATSPKIKQKKNEEKSQSSWKAICDIENTPKKQTHEEILTTIVILQTKDKTTTA